MVYRRLMLCLAVAPTLLSLGGCVVAERPGYRHEAERPREERPVVVGRPEVVLRP